MLSLSTRVRDKSEKAEVLRKEGILPGILYGPKIKPQSIETDLKEFKNVYEKAGESSLISLKIDNKEFLVLIHDRQQDPVSGETIHVDFYQPILTEEVEATVPIVFENEAPAVKELGGTLVKEVQELEVKALPQNLPHEIKINVETLKTFEDEILIKDIKLSEDVKIIKEPNEIVAKVVPPEKVEEELEKPIEEETEKVEGVEGEEKGEEGEKSGEQELTKEKPKE